MQDHRYQYLVSTEWLSDHLGAPDLVVLDGSWHLPTSDRKAETEYRQAHIPGAIFFDIDAVSDKDSDLPHMLPSPAQFASTMRRLGVGDGQTIVIYDSVGIYSAPRVWWMFRAMGAPRVFVLEGGLPRWLSEERPVEDGVVRRPQRHFTARLDHAMVATRDDVINALRTGEATVVDARSAERFAGTAPEPRKGVRSGHMPGARNLPYTRLIGPDGSLKAIDAVNEAFVDAGVDLSKPVITSCGSGVSAAILNLALRSLGHTSISVYDGSWAEWGGDPKLPVATGHDVDA
ncbi:3-mercaptopyruvate sulfurtransferase [Amorphus orientalis]|uniref:3-mercaptopyruvate sulfurtransferase n=1 Tax=Amorphus orientalis TaxID=649198 RepID=A0AAE4ATM3_9HYPH|nr:3-mercaptopyruvate sulfurtransferase [Amorphus orientalis]MDQ0316335.1 thiosulfate/3-mercaptopyruvate sulfurtransferase [Amorphus orientalis]